MSVVRIRPPGIDTRTGDPVAGDPTRLTIANAKVAPRSSSDVNEHGRNGVIVGLSLFAPYGSDIQHGDQVEVDGTVYVMEGEIGQWKNPFTGWNAGSEVALRRPKG